MRKSEEAVNPASCWNRALPNELVFVLLGRDPDAPAAIRAWASARRARLFPAAAACCFLPDSPDARWIAKAEHDAQEMEKERGSIRVSVRCAANQSGPVEKDGVQGFQQAPKSPMKSLVADLLRVERKIFERAFELLTEGFRTREVEAAFAAMKDVHCAIDALQNAELESEVGASSPAQRNNW